MKATTRTRLAGMIFFLLALTLSAGAAHAFPEWVAEFGTYAATLGWAGGAGTGTEAANCQVCHLNSRGGNNFNNYGTDVRNNGGLGATNITPALQAVEAFDSDGVGGTNKTEILAGTQPGWCVTTTTGCKTNGGAAPPAVTLDPAATNQPPVANAGANQAVGVGAIVTLDGRASSDPNSDPLTYKWSLSKPTGSAAVLSNAGVVQPTFVADAAGTYTAQLIVNDGKVDSAPATVTITASPAPNLPPVANAGPNQAVNVGQLVTLNGSGSTDPERHSLTYNWTLPTRPTGSTAALTNPTTVNPTFTPDAAGSYIAQLIVNDGTQNSAPATVTISAAAANLPPVANAGLDQAVNVGATVTLDGSKSSDPNSDPLTYKWSFVSKPGGSAATLSNPGAQTPTFVADVAGDYVAQLIVNDGKVDSAPDTVVIGAAVGNQPPTANAGPAQTVNVGATVTLDGSKSSDPNSDPLTYKWSFVSKPGGSAATLSNAGAQKPTFVADVAGQYVAGLVVNDGKVNSTNPANVVITANAAPSANQPPTANAGPAQTVNAGATVTLDGSKSSDPNSDPLTYKWSFVSKPGGSAATLSNPGAQKPTFVADVAGTYTVQLIVNDGTVDSVSATVVITAVVAAPPPTNGDVDYDVRAFKATEEVELSKKQAVRLRLIVKNVGKVSGSAPATLVGIQDGLEVYRETMAVSAPLGRTGTFDFRSYTPTAAGKIKWTVTIQDQGSGRNTATATTEVEGVDKKGTEHGDRKRS